MKTITETRKIKALIALFITLLMLSGITAFPVMTEMKVLVHHLHLLPAFAVNWITKVNAAIEETGSKFPFLFYGYDWLAFSHLVIALFFIGAYRNPVQNAWVIRTGMVACAGVFVLAVVCGKVRGIPTGWTLVDCSFGLFGGALLFVIGKKIELLKKSEHNV